MRVLCVLLFLSSIVVNAQEDKSLFFGLKGGVHYYNLKASIEEPVSGVTGNSGVSGYGGVFAEILIKKRVYLNTEIIYSNTYRVNFIQSVTHLRYKFNKRWSLGLGPQIDFVLNSEDAIEEDDVILKKNSFSVDFGVQYDFKNNMFFETRYALGLTSLLDYNLNEAGPLTTKLNSLRFGLGYVF